MSSKQLETAIRDKIKLVDGKQFQQLFWNIEMLRYADLQTPKMQHDLGNDGYSIGARIFFACYGPESVKYDNAATVIKMDTDYKSFCKNWKNKHVFTKWVFVTKDNLMGKPHQKLVDLNREQDGVDKEIWGLEQIVREALCLDEKNIIRIFDLPPAYLQKENNEKRDFGIIGEIFDSLFKEKIQAADVEVIKNSDHYTSLSEKLPLNFSGKELDMAKEMVVRNWERKALVERYVSDESTVAGGRVDALIDMVQSDFRRIKGANHHEVPIESVEIIENLAREYVSSDKQSNPDYIAGSRAIILYFFELCFLGDKTDKEKAAKVTVF